MGGTLDGEDRDALAGEAEVAATEHPERANPGSDDDEADARSREAAAAPETIRLQLTVRELLL